MRVTGGRLRGRQLAAPPSATRPTRDAVREAIFNLLRHGALDDPPPPENMLVLDLFAGSGALGIEALSRGASRCLFFENDAKARAILRANLDSLGLAGVSRVSRRDVRRLGAPTDGPYELVFIDPPYGKELEAVALNGVRCWMGEGSLAVVESEAGQSLEAFGWSEIDCRKYGRTAVRLLRLDGSV